MAALFRRASLLCQCRRTFSTASPRLVSLQWDRNDPEALAEAVPAYPYGPARLYKQSSKGLYGGQRIQSGNNRSEKHSTKTRRKWRPNILTKKLFSQALNRPVQVRVSARVLRTIDKLGGLDEYLLGEKEMRIKELGESGWWLRWAIMQTPAVKKRFAEERLRLGLPEHEQTINEADELVSAMEEVSLADPAPEDEEVSLEAAETLSTDDAFAVEQSKDLPALKFRVGHGKHVVLTADGWRRTRPDPSRRANIAKAKIADKSFPGFVEAGIQHFERTLDVRRKDLWRKEREVTKALEQARMEHEAKKDELTDQGQDGLKNNDELQEVPLELEETQARLIELTRELDETKAALYAEPQLRRIARRSVIATLREKVDPIYDRRAEAKREGVLERRREKARRKEDAQQADDEQPSLEA